MFQKSSLPSDLMHFIYVHSPGRDRQVIGATILVSTEKPHHFGHLLQVSKTSLQPLILYTSFHDLINVYSRGSGTDNSRGQNFDVKGACCHFGHLLKL